MLQTVVVNLWYACFWRVSGLRALWSMLIVAHDFTTPKLKCSWLMTMTAMIPMILWWYGPTSIKEQWFRNWRLAHDPMDIQCKHRCSCSVYSECCATHVAAYFPHISVGCSFGNRWHLFSAPLLVQRLLVQKVVISKTTLCVSFNTLTMAKPIPIRPLVQRLKRLSSVIHHEPAFIGGWTWFPPSAWSRPRSKKIHLST